MQSPAKTACQERARFQCGRYFAGTVRREDASERWAQWLNDPWVVEALNLAPRVLTKDDIAGYIKQSDQRTHLMLGIFERGTRVHVGIIRIDLDYAAREALVNAIIGEPEHRNRGATTGAFVSTLDCLFDKEGITRVRASVLARNNLTLQYLLKIGWELDEAAAGQIKSSADGSDAGREVGGVDPRILPCLSPDRAREAHFAAAGGCRERCAGAQDLKGDAGGASPLSPRLRGYFFSNSSCPGRGVSAHSQSFRLEKAPTRRYAPTTPAIGETRCDAQINTARRQRSAAPRTGN